MPRLRSLKNNFTAGEIAPDLLGRPDLAAYANGAARLRNVLIRPTGGIERRPGLRHVASIAGAADQPARLVAFSFNAEQQYLLLLRDGEVQIFANEQPVAQLAAPWTGAQLARLTWVQSADTTFFCHPDMPPQRLIRRGEADWQLQPFQFKLESDSGLLRVPCFNFTDGAITLTPSGTSGTITLSASAPVFDPGHVDLRFRIKGKEVRIATFISPLQVTAEVKQTLADTAATASWEEQAFSALRGWPTSVTLYQERLVFAGSRDLPNRVWMSKTSDITNFDLGKALDDEAIEFSLLTDQVDAIRAVVAGRHLQVFTSGAEWMIGGEPLTPAKVRADRQTRIGCYAPRSIPPRFVDGATLFVAAGGRSLRQFLFADVDQAYSADDVSLVAPHLFTAPLDMDYDSVRRLLLLPMQDGGMAVQTNYRAQQIMAWTRLETDGAFQAVAVLGEGIYVLVRRSNGLRLEALHPGSYTDACVQYAYAAPHTVFDRLSHLEGRAVRVRADGVDRGTFVVTDGAVRLPVPARQVEAGLPFAHLIQPLPADIGGDPTVQTLPIRMIRAVFRLQDTAALKADAGRGLQPLGFSSLGGAGALDQAPALFTGDREMRGTGWVRGYHRPLWRIDQDSPQPFALLSVTTELKGAD